MGNPTFHSDIETFCSLCFNVVSFATPKRRGDEYGYHCVHDSAGTYFP